MAKIMLVEDDKNLSSIYKDRLLAEGYDIVEAHDGEEALALAVKEKPVLIISDVMMPKISGFDMLDILRSTPETKNTRVIMMTALSQTEDQQRATQLGADKYLVKSQVTLDDVARVVKEVLEGGGVSQTNTSNDTNPTQVSTQSENVPDTQPNTSENSQTPAPMNTENNLPEAPSVDSLPAESASQEKKEIEDKIESLAENIPSAAPEVVPSYDQTQGGTKVLQPIDSTTEKTDIMALYQKEMANESTQQPDANEQQSQTQQQPQQPTDPHSISL